MVDVSVIIVNWNAGRYLLECLRSIPVGAANFSTEIILVDNASTDGSPDAVQRDFPRVTLIQSGSNLGFAKANNLGIRKSKGRYLCLINPDVVLSRGCLDHLGSYMDQHPSVGILGPKILNSDSTVQFSCRRFPSLWSGFCRALALDTIFAGFPIFGDPLMMSWTHDTVRRVDALSGCFWMLRRKTLERVGLLDEGFFMYSEDVDYCRRCWQEGLEVVYLPEVTALHYGGASSSHSPVRFETELLSATLRYWRKHHSRPAQVILRGITLLHQARRILQGTICYVFNLSPENRQKFLLQVKAGIACSGLIIRTFGSSPALNSQTRLGS